MTPRRWAWLLAVAVAAYLVLAGVRGWALVTSGDPAGVVLGVAVFALPIVGAWVVWRSRQLDRLPAGTAPATAA